MNDYDDDFYQSNAPEAEYDCNECGVPIFGAGYCRDCAEELGEQGQAGVCDSPDPYDSYDPDFADPGGVSALRAATPSNPRNLPCPTCGRENMLTPADRDRGYQCDVCAQDAERGY